MGNKKCVWGFIKGKNDARIYQRITYGLEEAENRTTMQEIGMQIKL